MRKTSITCTLGPASDTEEVIRAMIEAGMTRARLNLSHGTHESHAQLIAILKKLAGQGLPCEILLDTRGPEIRTGDVAHPIQIAQGQEVLFCSDADRRSDAAIIHVNYDAFARDVAETDRILVDNGEIEFAILSFNDDGSVLAKAKQDGEIGARRHINLPGADIDLPSVTKQDWEDIAFAVEQDADWIALSFVRTEREVEEVREYLKEKGSCMKIMSKIEAQMALERLDAIMDASDELMVARGDLGSDIAIEDLPLVQDEIVRRCLRADVPVCIATHMLESMSEHPVPTRAEVTDVAYAVQSDATGIVLTGETASGDHPVLVVETADRIIRATEGRKA